jgi:hypothetical protein
MGWKGIDKIEYGGGSGLFWILYWLSSGGTEKTNITLRRGDVPSVYVIPR